MCINCEIDKTGLLTEREKDQHIYLSLSIYIYIYIYNFLLSFVGPKREKVNILKWIGQQRDLFFILKNKSLCEPIHILLGTPSHGRAKAGWPARTYIQQLCTDTGCSLEDLLGAMDDRDKWQERVSEIHAGSATWWWGYIYIYIYIYIYDIYIYIRESESKL